MKRRCDCPVSAYNKSWAGRGISYDPSWADFERFYADMGPKPTPRHSLDRINGDGHYSKDNCRWATAREQSANLRWTNRFLVFGEKLTITEISEKYGVNRGTVCNWARKAKGGGKTMQTQIERVAAGQFKPKETA